LFVQQRTYFDHIADVDDKERSALKQELASHACWARSKYLLAEKLIRNESEIQIEAKEMREN
jgi:hypothetical protein